MDGRSVDGDLDATLAGQAYEAKPANRPVRYGRGAAVGRYTVLEEVGAGAVGLVYSAYDPQLDRKVALKVLNPRTATTGLARDRLQREAQALAKLGHPNVVAVYDVGVHEAQVYVAMEFIEGQTLGEWIRSAPGATDDEGGVRPWREVLAVFQQAGRGLAAAHEAGLVHRDFKPDNVMLDDDGRVRVMDFGLARIDRQPTGELTPADAEIDSLTKSGAMLGTPAYMSPEQFARGPMDPRSDQFSFCITLWEALYGERPFAGETVGALVETITKGSIRDPGNTDVPTWLRAVLARGLATDPQARFESMDALLAALAADPAARRRRAALTLGLVGVLGAGSWGVVTLSDEVDQRDAVIEEQATELDNKREALVEQLSRQRGLRAITLVGTMHEAEALLLAVQAVGAYVGRWDDAPLEAIEGLEQVLAHDPVFVEATHVLPAHDDYLTTVAYAPDGTRLISTAFDGRVQVWDPMGGRKIGTLRPHDGKVYTAAYDPDGRCIASASTDDAVRIWDANSHELLHTLRDHQADVHTVVFSADGARLASAAIEPGARIWDVQTGELVTVATTEGEGPLHDVEFSADGTRLVTAGADGKARIWDAQTGALLHTLEGHTAPILAVSIAPDGTEIATASLDRSARLWTMETGQQVAVFEGHRDRVTEVAFSPDGRRLATASWDSTGRLYDLATNELVAVLEGGHGMGIPVLAYAPDGTSIATGSYGGNVAVWDGETGELEARLRGHRADVWGIAFAPSGRQLATGSVDHTVRIWDLPDAQVVPLASPQRDVSGFAYSPDQGQLLTWGRGRAQIWASDDGELLHTLDEWDSREPTYIAYAKDGRHVAIARQGTIRRFDVDTGAITNRRTLGDDRMVGLTYSRGGTFLHTHDDEHWWIVDASSLETVLELALDGPVVLHADAPDDASMVLSTSRTELPILDPRTGHEQGVLEVAGAPIRFVSYAPDGQRLVTQAEGGVVTLWDAKRLVATTKIPAPADATPPQWSPDGTHIATGSGTEGVRLWNVQTGASVLHLEPEGQETGRATVHYARDGSRIAVSGSGFARVHDVATGKRLAYIDGMLLRRVQLSLDGTRLIGLLQDQTLEVWDAVTGEPLLRERIGVLQGDGSLQWPIPPPELLQIGCTRLQSFTRAYPEASGICDPLVASP